RDLESVEPSALREQPLRGWEVEDRDRRGPDRRALGVRRDSGDLESTCALVGGNANRVADSEVLRIRGVFVDCPLFGADRPPARGKLQRIEARVVRRVHARSDAPAAPGRDDLAIATNQL